MKAMESLWVWVLVCGFLLVACSDDAGDGGVDPGSDAGTDGVGNEETGNNGDPDAGPEDPLVAVPPVALERSTSVCPAGFTQTAPAAGQNPGFTASDLARSFYLQIPDADAHPGPRPMMVVFNGTGGDGVGAISGYGFDDLDDEGWIVVGPDSAGHGTIWPVWDSLREPGDEGRANVDMDFFDRLVDCMAAHYPVDAKRIYIAGKSAGGIMTNYVLRRR
jgi:poly(3-hydroxybutyrate) depolymerase